MGKFFAHLYMFLSRHRIWLYSLLILSAVIFGILASRLKTDEEISKTLQGSGELSLSSRVMGNLRLTDKIIIHIRAAEGDSLIKAQDLSAYATVLTDSIRSAFDSSYIASIQPDPADTGFAFLSSLIASNLPVYLEEKDYHVIDSLIRPEQVQKAFLSNKRLLNTPAGMVLGKRMLDDPLGISGLALDNLRSLQAGDQYTLVDGFVATSDMKNLLVFINSANPAGETSRNGRLVAGIRDIISYMKRSYPGIEASPWGGPVMAAGNAEQLKKDITVTLIIALTLIFLVLAWYFRSIRIPLLGFLPAIYGALFALAIFFLVKGSISAIALGIGSVLLGLIVDYALYIINHYRLKGSAETTLFDMSQSVILCALTSIGAFMCLLFLDSAVLADLGLFASLSLAGAALFALLFLPHFLGPKLLDSRQKKTLNLADRMASITYEKKIILAIVLVLAGIAGLFTMHKVSFEEDMNALNFVTPELAKTGEELDRINEVSLKSVYVVSTGNDLESALRQLERSGTAMNGLVHAGAVRRFSGVGNLLISDSLQQERIRRWNAYWDEGKKEELARILRESAIKAGFRPIAADRFILSLNKDYSGLNGPEKEYLATRVLQDWITIKPDLAMVSTVARSTQENRSKIYDAYANDPGTVVFDRQIITERFIDSVKSDFDRLVNLTMIFVTLLLIFSFGRIETGLVAALPMFFSWLVTLGFMGAAGIRFNIFNIIISSFIFGLGVDYSILMARGLLARYKYGSNDLPTFKASIILSSATTIAGVGALFFARHPALHSIALVSIAGVFLVVLITFVFVPLLAEWFLFRPVERGYFPVTARIVLKTLVTWGNIVLVTLILVIHGNLVSPLLPISKKRKEALFHKLFSRLSRIYITLSFPTHHEVENPPGEDFRKPAIIISNHQSLIETPALLRLHRKILILTNPWIFRNFVFGPVARLAGFIPVEEGIDSSLPLIRKKVEEGYSILIFPEGHRSRDGSIQRFHRGAFYLAERLELDILPVLIYGSGDFLPKGSFWGKPGRLFMKIMPRITPGNREFGASYSERTRLVRHYYIREYEAFRAIHGTPDFFRRDLFLGYLYKGPVLEWYVKVKAMLEKDFRAYHENLPREGMILDLGCGYGYIAGMMAMCAPGRRITAVDFDEEKILVAQNTWKMSNRLTFVFADVTGYSFGPQDGILLGDVLHYLTPTDQQDLLKRCFGRLSPGGTVIIREGDSSDRRKHGRTRMTEFISTRTGFNKTAGGEGELSFLDTEIITRVAGEYGLTVNKTAGSRSTSNAYYIIKR